MSKGIAALFLLITCLAAGCATTNHNAPDLDSAGSGNANVVGSAGGQAATNGSIIINPGAMLNLGTINITNQSDPFYKSAWFWGPVIVLGVAGYFIWGMESTATIILIQ